ncbi:MAG TPA: N-acetylmuramoyl-L-alanine amidase [Phycisphaerales bacterium]|nr:N-acetylmuramoyl-L-alanine amidase [Phycisphaerales bacterium]
MAPPSTGGRLKTTLLLKPWSLFWATPSGLVKGLIRNRFVVLRHAEMPSVLVETAFLTNPSEGAKLSDPEFQKVIAQQLAGGLANYMRGAYASRGRRPVE